jgi:2-iminobutanoate/2-iminopropanoate deaminase
MVADKRIIVFVLVFMCGLLTGAVLSGLFSQQAHTPKQSVYSKYAPEPIGPYSQGVQSGNLVFLSGQVGIDPATGNVTGGVEAQTTQAMENLRSVLAASGLSFSDVVHTRIYLTNISDFAAVNRVYGTYFHDIYPARSTIQVAGLPKGGLVEIEVVAEKH